MLTAALTGFATGFSLILAIGAQNAFVLRQGLLRAHVVWLCLLCAVSDAILITAGVAGFGVITAQLPWLPRVMSIGGGLFLLVYGALRLLAAWKGDYKLVLSGQSAGLWPTLATASFVFFFGLGYGARLLAPLMQSARSWRVLDVIIGGVMWVLAIKLLFQ
jgi:L-lysine exporter family protein LysE/ArgO